MHEASIVIARPERPAQLVLLFHGVGSSAANLAPLGEAIARARPDVMVVSIDAPFPSGLGSGREWFSVLGITEQNRPERIAKVMPLFLDVISQWQRTSGVGPAGTVLVGFSQGAILSLEATQTEVATNPAERVIALAGRFAIPVRQAPPRLRYNLIHGAQDAVVSHTFSVAAAEALKALGGDATLDLLPGLGHGIDARALQLVIGYLGEQTL
ncbi:MAG: esterase [Hydrogenophaga sp.]|uniref:esterase n=1 Tax=Hydrogenophaga sp. TaxID=1904254 RepID=UPI00271F46DB|nr:esterase [Hydrogenophaga sp.]MDO9030005.1 esterase [Hydrogenophaga sp.]